MNRKGLSVIEVIVALMLLTITMLGMAGSTARAFRQVTDASLRRTATHTALSRISALTALGCLRASSGNYTSPGGVVTEHWSVRGIGGFAQVSDTVSWL